MRQNSSAAGRIICRTCDLWQPIDVEHGTCRHRSPSLGQDNKAAWPETRWNDWCGEGEPAPAGQVVEGVEGLAKVFGLDLE